MHTVPPKCKIRVCIYLNGVCPGLPLLEASYARHCIPQHKSACTQTWPVSAQNALAPSMQDIARDGMLSKSQCLGKLMPCAEDSSVAMSRKSTGLWRARGRSPRCRQITARTRRGPALLMATAFCATMLVEMRMVMLAASRGAKGLSRFMTLGKDRLSHAPSATGANTTCTLPTPQSPQLVLLGAGRVDTAVLPTAPGTPMYPASQSLIACQALLRLSVSPVSALYREAMRCRSV